MHNPQQKAWWGTCGFAAAQTAYFGRLPAVEIDSTFYNLPRPATAARWRAAAPPEFAFCLKAWQVITHAASSPTYKRTRIEDADRPHCGLFGFNPTVRWAWERTLAIATLLAAPVVVFQSPASFRPTKDHLARLRMFFERAKRGRVKCAWEPRGAWPDELVDSLCHELDLVRVVDPFVTAPVVAKRIQYYRLHGMHGPRHRYSDAELNQLAEWCGGRGSTYCFFNNRWMWVDALRLGERLISSRAVVRRGRA